MVPTLLINRLALLELNPGIKVIDVIPIQAQNQTQTQKLMSLVTEFESRCRIRVGEIVSRFSLGKLSFKKVSNDYEQ